jgi:hypothetical protein
VTTRGGDVIRRDAGGQVRQVRMNNGTVVYHPPNAPRRVEVVRPGGRVVVASAPGRGYVQRPVVIHNTTIIKRTYIYNGVPQADIPSASLQRSFAGRLHTGPILPADVLCLRLQSMAATNCIWMGLEEQSVVWILRRILHTLSRVCQSFAVADGLSDRRHSGSRV